MKPVMPSSLAPSGAAAASTACTTNQVATAAANATPAPAATGRRLALLAPIMLAVTGGKIGTAPGPSRTTIPGEWKPTVAWLCGPPTWVGWAGPVRGVAIRYTRPGRTVSPGAHQARRTRVLRRGEADPA